MFATMAIVTAPPTVANAPNFDIPRSTMLARIGHKHISVKGFVPELEVRYPYSSARMTAMATRSFVKTLSAVGAAFAALWSYSARWQSQRRLKEAAVPLAGYFHPSRYALDVFRQVGDKNDFEEQMRGLMAPMQDLKIMGDVGPGLGHGGKKKKMTSTAFILRCCSSRLGRPQHA